MVVTLKDTKISKSIKGCKLRARKGLESILYGFNGVV